MESGEIAFQEPLHSRCLIKLLLIIKPDPPNPRIMSSPLLLYPCDCFNGPSYFPVEHDHCILRSPTTLDSNGCIRESRMLKHRTYFNFHLV